MSKIFFFSFIVCCFCSTFAQEKILVLPIVKAGNWYLHSANSEIKLAKEIQYVDLFDSDGTAYFQDNSGYGIIDQNGKIQIPAIYEKLTALGSSFYAGEDSLGKFFFQNKQGIESFKTIYDSIFNFNNNWIYYNIEGVEHLFNLKNQQRYTLLQNIFRMEISRDEKGVRQTKFSNQVYTKYKYVFFTDIDSIQYLINSEGQIINQTEVDENANFTNYSDYLWYQSQSMCFFSDGLGEQILPKTATNLRADNSFYYYTNKGMSYCVDRVSKAVVSYPCTGIYPYNSTYFMIENTGKYGLITKHGKLLIDAKYTYIIQRKNYWYAYDRDLVGLLDSNFKVLIPPKFTSIIFEKDYFKTFSYQTESYGLYYRNPARELIPCVYDKIEIQKNSIRAWSNSTLVIYELNEQLKVTQKIVLENVIPIDRRRKFDPLNFDRRLFTIGWFYDTISQVKNGEFLQPKVSWGLQNDSDSVLLKPRFKHVIFVNGAPVSLIPRPTDEMMFYEMIDWSTGKSPRQTYIYSLDSLDFMSRNYARFSSPEGWGILTADAKIQEFTYIEPSNDDLLRVCKGGVVEYESQNLPETVPLININTNGTNYFTEFYDPKKDKIYYYQKLIDGEWNFLDRYGNLLFDKPFLFAETFNKGTSIVKTETGWGVVCKDSFVIEPIYSSIKRLANFGDTAFLVQRNESKKFVTTVDFQLNPTFTSKEEKQKNEFYIFNSKGNKQLYNSKLEKIASDLRSVYLYDFGRYVVKNKKLFEIYNNKGSSIGETFHKPIDFLDEDHFTAESKNKMGLINLDGDTIIPFQQDIIEKTGTFFKVISSTEQALYDSDWKLILKVEGAQIHVDSISNQFAVTTGLKVKIYNSFGEKIGKLKTDFPVIHFHNKLLYSIQSRCIIYDSTGQKQHSNLEITEIEFLENGFYTFTDKEQVSHLFTAKQEEILIDFPKKRKIHFVSENVLCFRDRSNYYLYNLETEKISKPYVEIDKNFNSGFILVKENKKGKAYSYLNKEFRNEFKQHFELAKAFEMGFAPVRFSSGWTTINTFGLKQSYPSFGEIESLGSEHFLIKHRPKLGIKNSQGKDLIPCEYEQIEFISGNLIRTYISGEIGYFDKNGKVYYKP